MSRSSFLLVVSIFFLYALGLVMVFNTTSGEVLDKSLEVGYHQALIRQLLYGFIGLLLGGVVWFIGYSNLIRISPFLLFCATLLLIFVFLPGIGQQVNGAHRWLQVGGISFQPSEFAKYLIPIYFIYQMLKEEEEISFRPFAKKLLLLVLPIGLILVEPDNGTTAMILCSLLLLFFLTKVKWTYWLAPLCVLALIGGLVMVHVPYVAERLKVYLHPELDIKGKGHQPYQAKIAVGSGGLWGKGLGESLQKMNYLPEARSDYIAAIYAEELGFMGVLGLITLYMLFSYAGFSIAFYAKDWGGFYLAAVLTFLIAFQAFLNLGVVSGLLPSKGITLPFFSQGGTSLIVNCAAVALLLNVSAESSRKKVVL